MKKLLIGTTALVAAGIVAAPAMAADPIKLGLGGKMTQWAGSVSDQDTYEAAAGVSSRQFDVKGDSEVYFMGSTKLDNGLSISVKMELEADRSNNATSIDNSFMRIATPSMGAIILGSVNGNSKTPDEGYGTDHADANDWYSTPATNTLTAQSESVSREDSSRIDYTSPSFGGFKVGAGYVPEITTDTGTEVSGANGGSPAAYYYKASYDGKIGGATLSLAAQYVDIDMNATSSSTATASASWYEWRGQGSVSFAGFTLGGGIRDYHQENAADPAEGEVYSVGIGYQTGPYAFALTRYASAFQGSTTVAGDDKITNHSLSMSYNMGGGIKVRANYTDFDIEEENKANTDKNSGHILAVGVSAAF